MVPINIYQFYTTGHKIIYVQRYQNKRLCSKIYVRSWVVENQAFNIFIPFRKQQQQYQAPCSNFKSRFAFLLENICFIVLGFYAIFKQILKFKLRM